MKRILFSAILLVLSHAYVLGQTEPVRPDGIGLIKKCHAAVRIFDSERNVTKDDVADANVCTAMIHGEVDILQAFDRVTLPDGSGMEEHVRVLDRYLHNHPEELHERDTFLIMKAMMGAYPYRHHK
jgi:hypothetical protein